MIQYQKIISNIINDGIDKVDERGQEIREYFGMSTSFDLSERFPLVTTKKMWWRGIVMELLWFLSGSTNVKDLQEKGVDIWDQWADEKGNLGPVYGKQWRNWNGEVDQIKDFIAGLKKSPNSRRRLVLSYNPSDLPDKAPPGCHTLFQMCVQNNKLHCSVYQRSADVFIGLPWNIASYALLTCIIADIVNNTSYELRPGRLHYTIGSAHIYHAHFEQCHEILKREALCLPRLEIGKRTICCDDGKTPSEKVLNNNIINYRSEDYPFGDASCYRIIDYKHHSKLEGEVFP